VKTKIKLLIKINVIPLILFTSFALADECPTPPTSVFPKIAVKVDYDKKTKYFTYNYSISNGRESKIPIDHFVLKISSAPEFVLPSPKKWITIFDEASEGIPANFSWTTFQKPIQAGSEESGFKIRSYLSPGPVRYYIQGETGVRVGTPTPEDDEPIPDCPGFYDDISVLEGSVSGIVDGPAPENQVSVDLKLMDSKGERECGPVSPYEDKGLLNVLLKVNKGTKVSDIDLNSLRFGVGQAPLASSKRIGRSEEAILLKFDTQKVAIECERDRVLFLSGKTTEGKDLFGGASVKTKDCDKRPKRKKPIHRKNPHGQHSHHRH
jgi:hypothetical protein